MHTDEYEISLSRELSVCRNTIKRIKKTLELLEQKHNKTTEAFMDERRREETPPAEAREDWEAWESSYQSLKKWKELEKEYVEVYRSLKI